jgi:predicted transcriptional regulator of viral defense system
MGKSKRIAKADILKFFENNTKKVYSTEELTAILEKNIELWNFPKTTSIIQFITWLSERITFKKAIFEFPNNSIERYIYGEDVSIYAIALSLKKSTYLSHYSSLSFHNLTEQIPKTVYVTFTQTRKAERESNKTNLTQENIDKAFKKEQRSSNNICVYGDFRIVLLNGISAWGVGIMKQTESNKESNLDEELYYTDLERTLIDITVRPNYAGGVQEVLKAYTNAAKKVSVNRIAALLDKLDFIYPYHQAIGFYLEQSGAYKDNQINLIAKRDIKFDFYLTYNMENPLYSEKWKIFYPNWM